MFVPVAGKVPAATLMVWRKPIPLTGAYKASVCFPIPKFDGILPVMVTRPDRLAIPVPMRRGVDATNSCTFSPGTKPLCVATIVAPANIGDSDNFERRNALITFSIDTLGATTVVVVDAIVDVVDAIVDVDGTVVVTTTDAAITAPRGVTANDASDASDVPAAFVADETNVYARSFVNPATTQDVAGTLTKHVNASFPTVFTV